MTSNSHAVLPAQKDDPFRDVVDGRTGVPVWNENGRAHNIPSDIAAGRAAPSFPRVPTPAPFTTMTPVATPPPLPKR
jgi:hypothetical protein